MIKTDVKERKISRLHRNLTYLQSNQEVSLEAYLENFEKKMATRFLIQESVQICIDLAFHLCVVNKWGEPANYKDAFKKLKHNRILPDQLSVKMQNWVGLRTMIAHIYEEVEDSQVFSFIMEDLQDFHDFISVINNLKKT